MIISTYFIRILVIDVVILRFTDFSNYNLIAFSVQVLFGSQFM